ncbi:putative ATP-dependent helicase hrq1 [Phtheirospermum japonicum]|uniref:Putative ATP-dependent helicase hrq1 n=1 Tax=Phtheirospermum japonicum TaxID=374723 RepID=A0A830C8W2_9LAMI|nr:putative ATP-dependent helicase hrq1 [Phtheirospermum japonicum]
MDESRNDSEIEVRSLTGESIQVPIEANKTVQDLKLLLKHTFSPASSSPNFHLFLKGVKLNLKSQISDYLIGVGDFLVVVPFVSKNRQNRHGVEASETPSENPKPNEKLQTEVAESAWSDLMKDLSSYQDISNDQTQAEAGFVPVNSENKNAQNRTMKSKKELNNDKEKGTSYDVILSVLQASGDNLFDEQIVTKFIEFIDCSSCLSNPATGLCVMRESNALSVACLQLWRKRITISSLKRPLDQLHKVGFRPGIADLELLSQLCPRVICIVNNELEATKLPGALVITRSSADKNDQHEDDLNTAAKRLPRSKIVNSMKKRETSLKAILSKATKSLMFENGAETIKPFSLEDLLVFVKKADFTAAETKLKRERKYSDASSSQSYEVQCHDTKPLLPEEMVEHLRSTVGTQGQVVHIEKICARNANYVKIPSQLSENVRSALNRVGITRLYSHQDIQAESIQASLAGKNVIVATMTSSGKSLCYNIPVLEALLHNPLACALYLFPTKALAQDQLRALSVITDGLDSSLNIGIYDGDTSQEDRLWLRDNARLLITNPDMLHVSVLPLHGQFRRILSNLRFIVIDEAHTYKGTFGCHAALIFRRLRRICSHVYSSDPSFIFSTATSANPQEHAMELANLPAVELIKNDGSPSGLKLFMLWNPPLCLKTVWKRTKTSMEAKKSANKTVVAGRSSPILEVSYLFAEMVQHGLRCITFCKTRKLCELVLCYTREILRESTPHLADKVYSYRGGYIAEDRRRIESDFFNGSICGIAATNALELGIDVGHIDVTLHLGFPGSIASLWQQAGRSGRREKPSLAIYVAFEGPLDQYFMKFPHKLFRGPIECCHVDPSNDQVLQQHLSCSAHELPLSLLHDEKYFGPGLERAIMTLKNKGRLSTDMSRDCVARIWTYIGHEKSPSSTVNVRSIETERYKVIDETKNEVLEEIEESKAFFQVYDGAVYMNQGKTYLVKHLDLSTKIAWCQQADLKYYTKTRDYTDIHVIGGDIAYPARITDGQFARTTAQTNMCKVTTTWFGFRRIWRRSNQVLDTVELSLPEHSYESQAVWIRVPQSVKTAIEISDYSFHGGLHAAGHALLNVIPLFIICNQSDLASECANPHDNHYVPERILLYDPHPGGTGISAKVQPLFTELLTAASELLSSCHCSGESGCPNCVQNLTCNEYNEVLHKDAAIMIIKGVLDAEQSNLYKNADSSTV